MTGLARVALKVLPIVLSGDALSCVSFVSPAPDPWVSPDPSTWAILRERLEKRREALPRQPWTAGIRVRLREPQSGRDIDGRGAIAVAPEAALRMILLGPAGVTMMDAWVTPDHWRIAVPPLGMVRRGDTNAPDDLPVSFLRYAFFRPLAGRLFAASIRRDGLTFLLRDAEALVEVREARCDRGTLTLTRRRNGVHVEHAEECRKLAIPQPGDWVTYRDERSGVLVGLAIESLGATRPDAEAFADPDSTGAAY